MAEVSLAGTFPELEDELCAMTRGCGWAGRSAGGRRSPDRANAMVWGLSTLLEAAGEARVRGV